MLSDRLKSIYIHNIQFSYEILSPNSTFYLLYTRSNANIPLYNLILQFIWKLFANITINFKTHINFCRHLNIVPHESMSSHYECKIFFSYHS